MGVGPLQRLAALLKHVLSSLGEQSQLGIQLLPKLNEPFEFEPSHVLDVLGADADADPLLVVYKLVTISRKEFMLLTFSKKLSESMLYS